MIITQNTDVSNRKHDYWYVHKIVMLMHVYAAIAFDLKTIYKEFQYTVQWESSSFFKFFFLSRILELKMYLLT